MNPDDSPQDASEINNRYRLLRDKVLDRSADLSEQEEFEKLVLTSPELKADFASYLHQESALLIRGNVREQVAPIVVPAPHTSGSAFVSFNRQQILALSAIVTTLLMIVALGTVYFLAGAPRPVLVISSTKNCQWAWTTSATTPGKPLPPGRFILNSGIAELKLPLVDLSIEGPTDIEVISSKRCMVRSGKVFANVHPGGEGFVVETPTSILTDRGTVFAVNVSPGGDSNLTVIKGVVDAQHRTTGESLSVGVKTGLSVTQKGLETIQDLSESGPLKSNTTAAPVGSASRQIQTRQMQISTAVGNGRDAYVIAGQERSYMPTKGMLLAKITPDADWLREWRRRTYLHFDLNLIADFSIKEACLQLRGVSTNIGYLSQTPDSSFAVYGLTDESKEDWNAESINWSNSPGVLPDRVTISPESTVLLGRFVVMSSDVTGVFKIEGTALTDFLSRDTNGGATLILVAETMGQNECWAHGFASSRHPDLPPPTLRLLLDSRTPGSNESDLKVQ